ncbi:hypothetical protein H0H92_004687 [Tricholoma furcatifolium]|nr:hypothetical protein H0H92_004687 [Tricholoma furcatifolium]
MADQDNRQKQRNKLVIDSEAISTTIPTTIPPGLRVKMAAMTTRSKTPQEHPIDRRSKKPLMVLDPATFPGSGGGAAAAGLGAGRPSAADPKDQQPSTGSLFAQFSKIVDPSGALNFSGKAVLHPSGVDFSSGASFTINMSQLDEKEEIGRGNYGTVKKVIHKPTNVEMAMKKIQFELDDAKLNAIIMELDVLHRAVSPEIVEFYGAFFVETCVHYCMEYMDAGSLDKLYGTGIPEDILGRITSSTVRDVKPTNVLANTKGEIKLCDFGVSGQLHKSFAKTKVGCQSYMAPERIDTTNADNELGAYTVSSDVWSLGLSMVEMGTGHYPYPFESYINVFAQLQSIVNDPSKELPEENFSPEARDFVARCLLKVPTLRPTYQELLDHPYLKADANREANMVEWVKSAMKRGNKLDKQSEAVPTPSQGSTTTATPSGSAEPSSSSNKNWSRECSDTTELEVLDATGLGVPSMEEPVEEKSAKSVEKKESVIDWLTNQSRR